MNSNLLCSLSSKNDLDKIKNKYLNLNSSLIINKPLNKNDQFQSMETSKNLVNDQSNITIQLPDVNLKNQYSSGISSENLNITHNNLFNNNNSNNTFYKHGKNANLSRSVHVTPLKYTSNE